MKFVITGASGYIGRRLTRRAMSAGHEVIAASRRPIFSATSWLLYDLDKSDAFHVPRGTDVVVHLAIDKSRSKNHGVDEIRAAQSLIAAANRAGARFLFVSSQTACPDAPTPYGRVKWQIEQVVLASGGWVIRPGQVYGGEARGVFGELVGIVSRFPVLPAFFPSPNVQPIHIDDLVRGLMLVAEGGRIPSGVVCLATPTPVAFDDFLATIARARIRRSRWFVPVPLFMAHLAMRLLGDDFGGRLMKLRSLIELKSMETSEDIQRLGLSMRPLRAGMYPSGDDRRRRLLREGWALMAYILKMSPAPSLLRRYVRAIEHLRNGHDMDLPGIILRMPSALALIDEVPSVKAGASSELFWRLNAASLLAEASTQGGRRFLGYYRAGGVFQAFRGITGALAGEALWRGAAFLAKPFLRHSVR